MDPYEMIKPFGLNLNICRIEVISCLESLEVNFKNAGKILSEIPDEIMEEISTSITHNIYNNDLISPILKTIIKKNFQNLLKPHRYCSQCSKIMTSGNYIEIRENQFCSNKCLLKHISRVQPREFYNNDEAF